MMYIEWRRLVVLVVVAVDLIYSYIIVFIHLCGVVDNIPIMHVQLDFNNEINITVKRREEKRRSTSLTKNIDPLSSY